MVDAINADIRAFGESNADSTNWIEYPAQSKKHRVSTDPYDDTIPIRNRFHWKGTNPNYLDEIKKALENQWEHLDWSRISQILPEDLLIKYKNKIDWKYVAINRNAKSFILGHLDRIIEAQNQQRFDKGRENVNKGAPNLGFLAANPTLFENENDVLREMIKTHHGLYNLCGNSNDWATKYALFEISKIRNFGYKKQMATLLSSNTNPLAIKFLEDNRTLINWMNLSENPAAIKLIIANREKIDLDKLCANPAALHLLRSGNLTIHWGNFYAYGFVPYTIPENVAEALFDKSGMIPLLDFEGKDQRDYDLVLRFNRIERAVKSVKLTELQFRQYKALEKERANIAHRSRMEYEYSIDTNTDDFRIAMVINYIIDHLKAAYGIVIKDDASNMRETIISVRKNESAAIKWANDTLDEFGVGFTIMSFYDLRCIRNNIMHRCGIYDIGVVELIENSYNQFLS